MTPVAGTLYAGDGVTIKPGNLSIAKACVATLRFPRTSFPSDNMTLCVRGLILMV
jgi:hypothetical protein